MNEMNEAMHRPTAK